MYGFMSGFGGLNTNFPMGYPPMQQRDGSEWGGWDQLDPSMWGNYPMPMVRPAPPQYTPQAPMSNYGVRPPMPTPQPTPQQTPVNNNGAPGSRFFARYGSNKPTPPSPQPRTNRDMNNQGSGMRQYTPSNNNMSALSDFLGYGMTGMSQSQPFSAPLITTPQANQGLPLNNFPSEKYGGSSTPPMLPPGYDYTTK